MDDSPQNQKPESDENLVEATIHFNIPIGMAGLYAHQLMVQPVENEVVLSFYEVIPPVLIGTTEERKALLARGVQANCVARIIVANNRYPDFVKAISEILENPRFKKMDSKEKGVEA